MAVSRNAGSAVRDDQSEMGANHRGRPAALGQDDVIRFVDGDHFLEELAGNLGRGRAFVTAERPLDLNTTLHIGIEVPGASGRVDLRALVVFAKDGYVGLQLEDFEDHLEALDALGRQVEAAAPGTPPPADTVFLDGPIGADGQVPATLDAKHLSTIPADATLPDEAVSAGSSSSTGRGAAAMDDLSAALAEYLNDGPIEPPDREAPSPPAPSPTDEDLVETKDLEPAPLLSAPPPPSLEQGPIVMAVPPVLEGPAFLGQVGTSSEDLIASEDTDEDVDPFEASTATGEDAASPKPDSTPIVSAPTPDVFAAREISADLVQTDTETPASPLAPSAELPTPEALAGLKDRASDLLLDPAEQLAQTAAIVSDGEADEPAADGLGVEPAPEKGSALDVDGANAGLEQEASRTQSVEADGLEALTELASVVRVSPGGALRLKEVHALLGLWLSGLDEGVLTVHGGPEGPTGQVVQLKLIAGRVVTVDATIVARVGPWLTLKVMDPAPIRDLIVDAVEGWRGAVHGLGLEPVGLGRADASELSTSLSNPSLSVSTVSGDLPRLSDSNARVPLPAPDPANASAEPPRLEGNRVIFRHSADLRQELDANLVNGGLFVSAEPLPIRTKKRLALEVGGLTLPVTIDADVVFSSGGRVGFSVSPTADLCAAVREALAEGILASSIRERGVLAGTGDLSAPPSTNQLLELESQRTGDLELRERPSALGLFDELVSGRFRGLLTLTSENGDRKVYFHDGNVAFLESSPFEETTSLGRILTHHRRLSESALRDGLSKAQRANKPLGRALVALGLAKSGDIVSALREQTRSRLAQVFEWRAGQYELAEWEEPPGQGELVVTRGMGILAHHLRHRFEHLGLNDLENLLAGYLRGVVQSNEAMASAVAPLGLQPKELRFLQVSLDGRRTLEEAVRLSPVGKLASLRLAAIGLALGLVRGSDTGTGRPAARPRDVSTGTSARQKRELEMRLELLEGQNHFDVLGIHWTSHPRTFKAAYDQVVSEFSVANGPYQNANPEVQALARKCAERVKIAFQALADETKRVGYRKENFDRAERDFAAQMLVEKGEVALMRGDKVSAIELLESAVELAPTDRNRSLLRTAREGRG